MNGKLNTLGLTLLAVIALGGITATGASAEGEGSYVFESPHAEIEGSQTEATEFQFGAGIVKCEAATFEGTASSEEEASEEAKEPVSELTITPSYGGCTLSGLSVTVDMNGCQYTFTAPEEAEESPPFDLHAKFHIVNCSSSIRMTMLGCTIEIPEQTPETPTFAMTHTGIGPLEALVTPTVKGISYSFSGPSCGSGSASNGAYRGPVEMQGVAPAANLWFSIEKAGGTAGGGVGFCKFTAAGQTCQIKFQNITARTLRVLSIELLGKNAGARYKKLKANCVFNLAFGECTDELEAVVIQAGGINDYCLTVEDKGTGATNYGCAVFRM